MTPKKKNVREKKRVKRARRYGGVATVVIISAVTLATMAGVWRNSPAVRRMRSLFISSSPPTIPPANNPSKEYIYAGGKLIATEAPVPLMPPTNVVATTLSNLSAPQITISWEASQGADHYEVEKTTNVNAAYTSVNSNVNGTSLTDANVTPVTAYLYHVRAVANGNSSPWSNIDLATAISFTDDTLTAQSTLVKAAHISELRQAVDAVRATTATLGPANWGGSITSGVTTIQAAHIQDLRTNLDQARSALGLTPCSYTDNSVEALRASYIKKEHIEQIRQCVK